MTSGGLPANRFTGRTIQFVRHLLEMTLAMMLGMLAGGVVFGAILAAAATSYEETRVNHPELFLLVMIFNMSLPMVAWMRHRGHSWAAGAEMTAAMVVPALGFLACYWFGAISAGSVCPLACAAMIPSMAVAMLLRLDEYTTRPHAGHAVAVTGA